MLRHFIGSHGCERIGIRDAMDMAGHHGSEDVFHVVLPAQANGRGITDELPVDEIRDLGIELEVEMTDEH